MNFLFVSLDTDKRKLAKYLLSKDAEFKPFMLPEGKEDMLTSQLRNLRIYYTGSLPFTVLIDNTGNPLSFTPSPSFKDRVEDRIKETLKRYENK